MINRKNSKSLQEMVEDIDSDDWSEIVFIDYSDAIYEDCKVKGYYEYTRDDDYCKHPDRTKNDPHQCRATLGCFIHRNMLADEWEKKIKSRCKYREDKSIGDWDDKCWNDKNYFKHGSYCASCEVHGCPILTKVKTVKKIRLKQNK